MPAGTAIFPDTSIHIARFLREPQMKEAINRRLASYDIIISSPVVIQEFKRRVIHEAVYLMNLLNAKGSYEKVKRHVLNVLPEQQNRKRNICLNMLEEIFHTGTDDAELTERAKSYLRTLIKFGVKKLRTQIGHIVGGTGCYLSTCPVKEKIPYKHYELGSKKCSNVCIQCPIVSFLKEKSELCNQMSQCLSSISNKTKELESALKFLQDFLSNPDSIHQKDPCYTVGDILIALESHGIPDFYTMNYKESNVYCDILKQKLIVRPNNPENKEEEY